MNRRRQSTHRIPLTRHQKVGLEAAILAHVVGKGEQFARAAAVLKEELQEGGSDGADALVVSGAVLGKAWTKFIRERRQEMGLNAAILAYLIAEGDRFERTVATIEEDAHMPGGCGVYGAEGALVARGKVLDKMWKFVHRDMNSMSQTTALSKAIETGDLAEVQLYECVRIDIMALRHGLLASFPLCCAAFHNCLEITQYFVESGYGIDACNRNGSSPIYMAAQEGHVAVVQYLVEQGADKEKAGVDGTTPLLIAAY